ncbi:MAG: Ribonuclease R [Parcubacteria group bacterium GW2011_GWA1_44_13]|uniref:Ribonuclease R n=1 Tax=Candidatus Nomurabacteria bacterium GW2011_GWB1_44_12 TaxID=1618748 RepID=A0A837IE83_9BACT|nr:MAG: Ribonuclease R [Candidatus Nomurabacteria bacterium GW2011_GWD1_44_10]KKT37222.1 MAG: Ribonuclease R [Candidatus Nomurabacteria bacterium GW2011_GWB1_44_12]KKT38533.1 MAG: Ribonuclease R [Parcubacteria group bacterium GW2011_GWA1_44_13]KKT60933.1 MAG: Ribonuclease R [Parcubacteria group bacterium GW2011_GWC1_44_26]HBB44468.1 ribonuclease R [Candidatus Yonathbacteria bacterium]
MNTEKARAGNYVEGVITTTAKGFGFVSVGEDSPRENDIKVEAGFLNTALPRDRVKVRLNAKIGDMQQTGEVVEILARNKITFVGTVDEEKGATFLIPQDTRIYVDFLIPNPPHDQKLRGKKALVRLMDWTDSKKSPTAEIIEILGDAGDNETEIRAIVLDKGLQMELPEKIHREADALKKTAPEFITEEAKKRRDFRNVPTFTIDPADAKDFDDAISIQTLPSGEIEIGVHIADVSAYVKPHSAIDEEARVRATSIYLVDRVIPMFPEVLSNDLCSLNEKEDKLVFSAVFTFAPDTATNPISKVVVKDSWFGRGIINSAKRFTYENAQEVLDNGKGLFYDELHTLNTIAKKLAKQDKEEGAISFEHEEVRFELDANKKPIRVYTKTFQDTNKLVEMFMLLANKKVAEYVSSKLSNVQGKTAHPEHEGDLFVYRVHDEPKPERLAELAKFVAGLGYKLPLKEGRVSSTDINKFLEQIKGKPEETMLNTATVRTMAKAIYSTRNIGHYGLAYEHYTHFTSPIRRYPDVMVHRILAHFLSNEKVTNEEMNEYRSLAVHSSEMEKLASDAERASIKFKQAEYMSERVGKEFTGIISGVAEWGVFVEEEETKCEGLIRISDLGNDYYIFEREKYRIVGKQSHEKFTLGDKLNFRVKAVDLEKKSIDYELVK